MYGAVSLVMSLLTPHSQSDISAFLCIQKKEMEMNVVATRPPERRKKKLITPEDMARVEIV